MHLRTLPCILIACLADFAAVTLLVAGRDTAALLLMLGSGAMATAGAGTLLRSKKPLGRLCLPNAPPRRPLCQN